MNKKAISLKLSNIIKIGRKQIQITGINYNSGALGDFIQISGIDLAKNHYIKPFIVSTTDKLEVVA